MADRKDETEFVFRFDDELPPQDGASPAPAGAASQSEPSSEPAAAPSRAEGSSGKSAGKPKNKKPTRPAGTKNAHPSRKRPSRTEEDALWELPTRKKKPAAATEERQTQTSSAPKADRTPDESSSAADKARSEPTSGAPREKKDSATPRQRPEKPVAPARSAESGTKSGVRPASGSARQGKGLLPISLSGRGLSVSGDSAGRGILRRDEYLVTASELDTVDFVDDDDLPEGRDYLPLRFRRTGGVGIFRGLLYALVVIGISVVLACMGWLFASDVLALNKPDNEAEVTIEAYEPADENDRYNDEGDEINVDIDEVAQTLKSAGIIEYKWLFRLYSRFSHANTKIDPGTYTISSRLDYRAIVTALQVGSEAQQTVTITFPEGYTMDQVFSLLQDNGVCSKEDLYDAAANCEYNYSWLDENSLGDASRLEGFLFPDTYEFYQGEQASYTLNRFLSRFHYILTADMLQQAENNGVTIHQAVIIASYIEKEAGANDDRSLFAGVIYNRLYNGWPLQLDSTLNYIKNTSTFDLTYDDMEIDSPYNTYLYTGLTPGAICNPGLASIQAALQPTWTDYWYWYAVDGETYFFSDSSSFNNFAAEHSY